MFDRLLIQHFLTVLALKLLSALQKVFFADVKLKAAAF
jgi:hypothetical protein